MSEKSLQETWAPKGRCFGCGPANEKGLRIRSMAPATFNAGAMGLNEVIADFTPEPHHEAFENVLNGGIIGALLDCHSNWTAAWHLMKTSGADSVPCTVTAEFSVKLKRPTSSKHPVRLSAKVVSSEGDRAVVEATLMSNGKVTSTCTGTFVAVKPDHPAYHRW